jgi:hypothetical protein
VSRRRLEDEDGVDGPFEDAIDRARRGDERRAAASTERSPVDAPAAEQADYESLEEWETREPNVAFHLVDGELVEVEVAVPHRDRRSPKKGD